MSNSAQFYEVVESRVWVNVLTGRQASPYVSVPLLSENERSALQLQVRGWTVKNPHTGEVGIGRAPCATFDEACQLALRLGPPSRISIGY